jgi:hypothetical protein
MLVAGGSQLGLGLDGIDLHSVDGGIEVSDPEPDGAAYANERDESAHAPDEKLAGTGAEVFACGSQGSLEVGFTAKKR